MSSAEFRLDYRAGLAHLRARLAEPAPGRIQLLTGPRQVGKTTLTTALADALGPAAVYEALDAPAASLPGFWGRIWTRADEAVAAHGRAVVFLDEVHLVPDWAARLKGVWDQHKRAKTPVQIVATGSSALKLASGSRESLSGRFERTTLTHWSASAVTAEFALSRTDAAELIAREGCYPGAMPYRHDARRWAAYVNDAILEPAIGRDVLALGVVRKPALLRQVFGVAAASPAHIVSLQKIQGQLQDAGALETIAHYLALLEEAYLVAAVPKYAARASRQRAAPPKLVTLNNALVAVLDPHRTADAERRGALVENACLAHAWNAGQSVSYWREEPLEVDAIVEGSWGKWAIEIKTGRFQAGQLKGLFAFTTRFPSFRPLVLCEPAELKIARDAGAAAKDWRDFLHDGPG